MPSARLHPTPAARPPPPLHACWGQGGQSILPPFPFARRQLCLGCSLLAYTLPAACAPSPTLCSNAGEGTGRTVCTHPSVRPSARAMPPPSPRLRRALPCLAPPAPLPLCTHAREAQGMVSPLPVHGGPLHLGRTSRLGAPPRPHALLRACQKRRRDGDAHKGRTAQRVPRARRARGRGGPHAMGPRVRRHASVEDRTQGDHTRGEGVQNDGQCNPESKQWRHEGCVRRARCNPGKECCAQAERGCENEAQGSGVLPGAGGGGVQPGEGAAHEQKAVRTVSAPPRPVDQLVENPVTYLANKFEFLLLVNE